MIDYVVNIGYGVMVKDLPQLDDDIIMEMIEQNQIVELNTICENVKANYFIGCILDWFEPIYTDEFCFRHRELTAQEMTNAQDNFKAVFGAPCNNMSVWTFLSIY